MSNALSEALFKRENWPWIGGVVAVLDICNMQTGSRRFQRTEQISVKLINKYDSICEINFVVELTVVSRVRCAFSSLLLPLISFTGGDLGYNH